ncbi:DEAD/DEAH box helicase [Tessaracoccus caeni]|uniref:DEAD/DEAH box helicase n=1 Tax=Tessaracoccus caeni TaxID=3031239 RepID=UPI0023DC5600|nr:DEAD/DEAH box helicase [Tessaracoccus caeni]MDF1488006.1 DEAD/DEAH box helicase [Tessaracoccus caeni]
MSDSIHPLVADFAAQYPFALDDYQLQGCDALAAGKGALVAAPTGAGKTVVGEFAVHLAVEQGRKCFYTTPIKALSNQKFHDLVDRYGADRVGLLTGDLSVNAEAQVVVMTTEVLRNMIYAESTTLRGLGYVVLDEVHYLADKFRGAVWEEVILGLSPAVQLVALSATVSNVEDFGDWLRTVRGDVATVVSERRPVPLFQHVLVGRRLVDLFEGVAPTARELPGEGRAKVNPELLKVSKNERGRVRDDSRNPRGRRGRGKQQHGRGSGAYGGATHPRFAGRPTSRAEVAIVLDRAKYLPAIYFIFSRVGCDAAVGQVMGSGVVLTSPQEARRLGEIADRHASALAPSDLEALGYEDFREALTCGVAAHHAGQVPAFKAIVEEGFQSGALKLVFATETLALGINMPARTVVLEKLTKYNGESHVDITPGEFTQLTGRAGRRGIDVEGHAVVLWQAGMDPRAVAGLASRRTYPLRSSFAPTYNMAVNLMSTLGRERARALLSESFSQYLTDKTVVQTSRRDRRLRAELERFLEEASCHLGDFMEYARLRDEVSRLEASTSKRGRRDEPIDEYALAQIGLLRAELRAHPCHRCPDREIHAVPAATALRLEREATRAEQAATGGKATLAQQFDRVTAVLSELGYLDGDALTGAGAMLCRIYNELDLVAAECVRRDVFAGLDAPQLAAVLSTMVYESRPGRNQRTPRMPDGPSERAQSELRGIWRELGHLERRHSIDRAREPDIGFAESAWRWASGHDLAKVLRTSGTSAGDFVRSARQVIDLAGQLAQAIGPGDLRRTCREVVGAMRRGVVAADMAED